LYLFLWKYFSQLKTAVKAYVIMNTIGAVPVFISITTRKVRDIYLLNPISLPAFLILIVNRIYLWILKVSLYCSVNKSALSFAPRTICALSGLPLKGREQILKRAD
jgi:hypothetical protein